MLIHEDKIYQNNGNIPLLNLIKSKVTSILDVGCGAGNNAEILKSLNPQVFIDGITYSNSEAVIAKNYIDNVWVYNLEEDIPQELSKKKFDVIIFSHILEHLKNPETIIRKLSSLLKPHGFVVIAVPNILSLRMRIEFLLGIFEYQETGILDNTHLRFFTYYTADKYLLTESHHLKVVYKGVSGSVPLWILRRYLLSIKTCEKIDELGCKLFPNLFGTQILLRLEQRNVHFTN